MITLVPRRRTRRLLCYGLMIVICSISIIDFIDFFVLARRKGHEATQEKSLQEVLPSLYISVYRSEANPTISDEWRLSLVNLIQYLGVEKTFVSLVEERRRGDTAAIHAERDVEMLASDFARIGGRLDIKRVEPWSNVIPETTALSSKERDMAVQASKAAWEASNRNLGLETMIQLALQGTRFPKILFLDELLFSV